MDPQCEELVNELNALYQNKRRYPFPYEGCAAVMRATETAYETFIPDLDMYFSTIAGYCSSARRASSWPQEKREQIKAALAQSFFEKYPNYQDIEALVTEQRAPDLFERMGIYESMRIRLLDLVRCLEQQ